MSTSSTDLSDRRVSEIRLGIVSPMANEEVTAVRFVNEVLEQCAFNRFNSVTFFAVLDYQSKDKTLQLLSDLRERQPSLRIVWAPENTCVADAYVRGYREALGNGCDWILEIDCGFSHQPSDISQFFSKMVRGYDCVFGSRFSPGGRISEHSLKRRIVSRGGTVLSNVLLGTSLKDMTSGFQLFTRPALQSALKNGVRSRGPFFQTEIKAYCRHLKITEVPIYYRGGSHTIDGVAIKDAFANLWRLFRLRLRGGL